MATINMGAVPAWHASSKPDVAAVIFDGAVTSWSELAAKTSSCAHALLAFGVKRNDHVAVCLPNSPELVATLFAIWAAGATVMPLASSLSPYERDSLLRLAQPLVAIGVERVDGMPTVFLPADWNAPANSDTLPALEPAGAWKVMASGGSTGRPKLIVAERPAITDPENYELFPWEMHQGGLGRPHGTMLCPGPIYHNGPLVHAFMNLFAGSTLVLMQRFDALQTLALIAAHKIEFAYFVPTMMRRIMSLPLIDRNRHDLSSLKGIVHTASACPEDLKRDWLDWLGPERVWETYGSTEAVASTLISGNDWLAHPKSVGKFFFGATAQIRSASGAILPGLEIGDVWVRPGAAGPAFSYIGAEPVEQDGWYFFGDLGSMDPEGYLYIADRRVDLIIRGGANIYPAEVEAAIEAHPAVLAAVVIGLPDDDLGATVHAIVQICSHVDAVDLKQFLQNRLALNKQPQSFEFTEKDLRDASGKLRRSAIRDKRIAKNNI